MIPRRFMELRKVRERERILPENEWNGDEVGFRIGCVMATFVCTYLAIRHPFVTDPETRTLVTVMEAIYLMWRVGAEHKLRGVAAVSQYNASDAYESPMVD